MVFDSCNSLLQPFRGWAKTDVFECLFNAIIDGANLEYTVINNRRLGSPSRDPAQKGGSVSDPQALAQLDERGPAAMIQPKSNRTQKPDYDINA